MKKKLLLISAFIALTASIVGCGETTVTHIASGSRSKDPATFVADSNYDLSYYEFDMNNEVKGYSSFREDLLDNGYILNGQTYPFTNVFDHTLDTTSKSISDQTDTFRMYFIYSSGQAYVHFPDKHEAYLFYTERQTNTIQIGCVDYNNDGALDIVSWAYDSVHCEYRIDIFDTKTYRMFAVGPIVCSTGKEDYTFHFYGNSFYINGNKVYYSNGTFQCKRVFNNQFPSYYEISRES